MIVIPGRVWYKHAFVNMDGDTVVSPCGYTDSLGTIITEHDKAVEYGRVVGNLFGFKKFAYLIRVKEHVYA
jgi:hypothetical protein